MKKIISLFKRNYKGDRLVYNEVVPGAEWVIAGEGKATIKYDGTACLVRDGKLYKRYDRKLPKRKMKALKQGGYTPKTEDYKESPPGWEAAEPEPNQHTGHWPGWVPVGDGPEDKWHRQAFYDWTAEPDQTSLEDGTYELVGPKVQGNPQQLRIHHLWRHGSMTYRDFHYQHLPEDAGRDFESIKAWLAKTPVEGIVWHHPDGRMVKIKRRDFGLPWPVEESEAK